MKVNIVNPVALPVQSAPLSRARALARAVALFCVLPGFLASAPAAPVSIWPGNPTPAIVSVADTSEVELGVKFQSAVNGYITGIRFYKSTNNTGTHVGKLWTTNGTLLGSVVFSGETTAGWQQQALSSAIAISSNTTYIASYRATVGRYSADSAYFATAGVTNHPLRALSNADAGGNGVYHNGEGAFPDSSFNATHYWVDVVFDTTLFAETNRPVVSVVSPTNGQSNVSVSAVLTVTFSEPILAGSINTNTFVLRDATNGLVPATVSLTGNPLVATLTPNGPLAALTNFTATLKGGTNGIADLATNYLASDFVWSFTTAPGDTNAPLVSSASPLAGIGGVSAGTTVSVTFNEAMKVSTITTNTFKLRDAANALVPAAVTYDSATRQATLTPASLLNTSSNYTATVSGGVGGVEDLAGNLLATNYSWSFTVMPANPYGAGPGGRIVLLTATTNPITAYYAEILQTEGLNAFALRNISTITSTNSLTNYDVAILGEMTLTTTQTTTLSNWVVQGGKLIAMRPDKKLAPLLGLTDLAATLSEGYIQVNTASGPGEGIEGQTMQFHGTADRYALNTATSVATLYTNATTATTNPAVTMRSVGSNGGYAAAFTYDLARSVVCTRQGNPAWVNQERDGVAPLRSDDLFYGAAGFDPQPNYVNLAKVAIPQADEQQRLLANLIIKLNLAKRPLPRFWYFPDGHKAVVVMTGDDHANAATAGRFDQYIAFSPTNGSVSKWETVRGSSYMYHNTPMTGAAALAYQTNGFEIGLHVNTGCADYTRASLETFFTTQLALFQANYPGVLAPTTLRTHCIAFTGYTLAPEVGSHFGIRLDVNYYYWPPGWVANQPGVFTGSAMPMRFATLEGNVLDVFQAATQLTDESNQTYPFTINTLLDRALGTNGYYGAYVANMHTDYNPHPQSDSIVTNCLSRGVPIVTARQLLDWVDARNASTYTNVTWTNKTLTFSVVTTAAARGLATKVPIPVGHTPLNVRSNSTIIAHSTEVIKGVAYASFPVGAANYTVNFESDTNAPVISVISPTNGAAGVARTNTVTVTFNEAMDPATITTNTIKLLDAGSLPVPASVSYNAGTFTATLQPVSLLGSGQAYTALVQGGGGGVKDVAGNALAADYFWSFTAAGQSLWSAGTTPAILSENDTDALELGLKFQSAMAGYVTGVRFYKGPSNPGPHVGNLWTLGGSNLASVTFSNETATGWQQQLFAAPVPVASNTTYVVSYFAPTGGYSKNLGYFSSGLTNEPLRALSNAAGGGNGVYTYGATSTYPTNSGAGANYWVDLVFQETAGADTNAPTVVTVNPASGTTNVSLTTPVTVEFNEAMNPATLTTNTIKLLDAASNLVSATISYTPGTFTATLQPVSSIGPGQTHTVLVEGGGSGVKDAAGNALAADHVSLFSTTGKSLWGAGVTPAILSDVDTDAVELGLKFRSAMAGYVTGVRFYKGPSNPGPHVGNLWTLGGSNLASVTFTNETTTGWQQQLFAEPVPVASNTTYVVSYFAPEAGYSVNNGYFSSSGFTNAPLQALSNAAGGGNGVYTYAATSTFPSSSGAGANYWVDLVFRDTVESNAPPPTVVTVNPASGTTNVSLAAPVTVVFSEAMAPSTINTNTFTLFNAASNPVPASVSYTAGNFTATLQPSGLLAVGETYTARVKGGAGGVTGLATNALAADYVWSFTTTSQSPASLWSNSVIPTIQSENDPGAYELGLKFQSLTSGFVTGVRFFKGATNTGTHIGHLWNSLGTNLATVTFSNETATGWQEQLFPDPVFINSNTTYVISYSAPNGGYAADYFYFATTGYTNYPLRALSSPEAGGNGVFNTTPAVFPVTTVNSANYWVDVLFFTYVAPDITAPAVVSVTPTNGTTGVGLDAPVTVTFDENMASNTLNAATFTLVDAASNTVPAAISYAAGTFTATLQPASLLAVGQTYTARVKGGVGGAADPATNLIAADYVWSFTTVPALSTTIWSNSITPANASFPDPDAYSLGVKFQSKLSGFITGIRFYKGTNNTGTHIGNLWTLGGSNLATVTFTNETAEGWQEQLFTNAVPISTGTTYVASYHCPNGGYAVDIGYFNGAGYMNYPLRALTNGEAGGNGVFTASLTNIFPATGSGNNYWVDVVYDTGNTAPTATNFAVTLPEDSSTNLVLQGGDIESGVTYSLVANPTNGALTGFNTNTGAITYTPTSNYFGADTFRYRVSDGSLLATGVVSLTISAVNDRPTATNFAVTMPEDTVTNLTLLGGDIESAVTYSLVANPTNGALTGFNTNTGALTYTPTSNYFGADTFRYRVSDGSLFATGTVSMTISAVNDTPTATNFAVTLPEDSSTNLVLRGGDVESVVTYSLVANPTNGALTGFNTNTGAITYTPTSNYFGADTFRYRVSDGSLLATGVVSMTISAVNDTPTATNFAVTLPEDSSTNLVLRGGDVESVVTYSLVANPTNGALTGFNTNTGAITYTPTSNYFGADTFRYRVSDGSLLATGVVSMTISAVNDTPTATNFAVTLPEDSSTNLTLLGGDVESVVTYSLVASPTNGALTGFNTNTGAITYTPTSNYFGADTFRYRVSDGSLLATGTVSLAVSAVNDTPTATNFAVTLPEDSSTNLTLLGGDVESVVTYSLVASPTNGALTGFNTNTGAITYTPTNNYFGADAFTYRVSDGSLLATGTVSLTVSAVNDTPTATNFAVTLPEDTVTNLTLLGGDVESAVTYSLVANPTNGAVSGFNTNTGALTYTPASNYFGADAFLYQVSDGSLLATGTVSLTVSAVNDAPTATDFAVTLPEDGSTNLTLLGGDVEGAATYSLVASPTNGVLTGFNTNTGALTYTPTSNYFGADAFTYRVSDGSLFATGTVSLTISNVNNAPTATDFAVTLPEDGATNLTLLGSDVESPVTYSIIASPTNGVLTGLNTNSGAITYTPTSNYFGADAFLYQVSDGSLLATGTVSLTISAVNDTPTAISFAVTLPEDRSTNLTLLGSDVEGPVTYGLTGAPTNGTLTGFNTNTGAITYRPNTNYFGADAFSYRVSDGSLLATGTVSLIVIAVDDPPVFVSTPTNRTIPEFTLLAVTNSATDVDTLANTLTYALVNPPTNAVIDTNGVITWTPTEAQGPSSNVLITVVSDAVTSVTNSFTVVVTEVNAPPVVANPMATQSGNYGTNYSFTFPTNTFADPETAVLTYTATNLPPGVSFDGPTRTFSGTPTAAGSFPVSLVATDDGLPALSATNVFNINMAPANLLVTAGDTNKVYGVELAPTQFSVSGLLNGDSVTNVTLASAGSATNAPVGSYAITPSLALGVGLTNYNIGYSNGTLTVGAASLLITAGSTNKSYGTTLNPTDYTATGLLNGDSVTNVTLTSAGSVSNAAVGGYAITPGLALGVGLTNYNIGYSNGTLSVGAANLLITATDTNKVYGTTLNPVAYTVTGLLNGDSVTNVTLTSAGSVSNAAVGSYAITPSLALGVGLTNYNIGYSNGNFTVGAASLLITAGSTNKSYGTTLNPTDYTATGLLNGDSVTNVTLTSGGSVSNAPVGSHMITPSLALGLGLTNYNIGYSNGTLSVGAASLLITASDTNKSYGAALAPTQFSVSGLLNGDSVTNVTLASAGSATNAPVGSYAITPSLALGVGLTNYNIGYSNGTLTVGAANLLITATDTNKVYGVELAPTQFSVTGLLNSDSVTNVTLASAGSATNAAVGGYAITPGLALGVGLTNYTVGYSNGTLTVGVASLVITPANTNKFYGTTLNPTAYGVAGLLNGDTVTNVVLSCAGAGTNAPVGSYFITASSAQGAGLTNYAITYNVGIMTVSWVYLTVTPNGTNKAYGTELTPTGYSVSGLLNGDSVTNVTLASAGAPTNAPVGSYPITIGTVEGTGLSNYTVVPETGVLAVTPASLTVLAASTNKSYGTTLNPTQFSVSGLLNGDSVTNVTLSSAGSVSNAPVGGYAITPSLALGLGLTNYNIGYSNGTLTVGAANLLITANDTNKSYGVELAPTQFSVSGLLNGDSVTNVTLTSAGSVSNAPVGSYAITPSLALGVGLTNYTIGYSNGNLTVGAASLLITATDTNKVYGVELAPTQFSVTGLLNADSVTNVTLSSAGSPTNAPVGSYAITPSLALGVGLTNYTIGYSNGNLTVGAASLLITATDTNKVYGVALTPTQFSVSGLLNGDSVTNITLTSGGSVSNAPVGSYVITPSLALGVGLTNYTIGYSNGNLTVGAANLLITATDTNKVYGTTLNPTEFTAAGLLNGDSVTNVTLSSAGSVSNAPVGGYAITPSLALGLGLTNYNIGYSNGTLTVGAANLLITANDTNKVYGTTLNPTEFTAAGLLNGDSVTNVTLSSAGSVSNAPVGGYAITPSLALGLGLTNYNIGYSNGTLTVGAANLLITANDTNKSYGVALAPTQFSVSGLLNSDSVTNVTLTSAGSPTNAPVGSYAITPSLALGLGLTNYTIGYSNGNLTVGAASLLITATDTNKSYGVALAPAQFSVSGLLNSDSVTNVTLTSAGSPTNAPVGSYAITPSLALGLGLTNYNIGYSNGTLTVGAASLLITANDTNKNYGASLTPTQFSVSGLLNSDSVTNVTLASTGSATNAAVGSYAITPSLALGLGLTNYNIGYSNGTLTVGAASLLITAGDTNKSYGASLTPTQFSVSGLLNSDSVTNVTLTSAGSATNAPVGSYAITPSLALGVGLTNYNIGYSNGTLSVGAASLLITANDTNKSYGVALAPTQFSVSGLLNSDSVTNVTLTSAGSPTNAPVGSYAITPSLALGLGLTNYNIGYSNGMLTVGAASLLITATDTNKSYGVALAPAQFSVTGLLNGDSVTNVTLTSGGSVSNAPVGSYTITPSLALGLGLTNYNIGYSNGTLSVGAASLLITASDTNKVYGVSLTPTQFSVSGLLNSDSVTNVTLVSAGSVSNAPVGSYAITPSLALGVGLTNYNLGYSNGNLTVGAANLLITANDTNKSYGVALAPTQFSVSGLLNSDSVTNVTLASAGSATNAPVGGYAITPSLALGVGLTNYNLGYSNGTLTVGAANLLITANNTNKGFGSTLVFAGNEFVVAGLLNGDVVTNATLASAGAAAGAAVGVYPITVTNAAGSGLSNYAIGYVAGTLTVTSTAPEFIITSITVVDGVATVTWNSVAGRTYRLLHKDTLLAPDWNVVPGDVLAAGPSTSHTNLVGGVAQRFYRVQHITNSAPELPELLDESLPELTTLTVTNTAADADLPTELLTYALVNAPTNAAISAAGVITWTPGEAQGPSTNEFITVVTDNGGLSASNSFMVVVTEVNDAPVFVATPPAVTLAPLASLTVTNRATDSDVPTNTLNYQLVAAPLGAEISTNGVITWTPAEAQGNSTNQLVTVVSDGVASATNSFTVTVTAAAEALFKITAITATNGVATVTWNSISNLSYVLQYKDNLTDTNWTDVPPAVVATGPSTSMTNVLNGVPQRFYRVRLGTITAPVPAPVIQSLTFDSGAVVITWTSVNGQAYRLQFKTNLLDVSWTSVVPDVTAPGPTTTLTNLVGGDPQRFYRVMVP